MNPFEEHGAFSWTELMTNDPKAAANFYENVFGWSVRTMDMPTGPYHVIKAGDQDVGGIMKMPDNVPPGTPPHWGAYVTVDDVDAVAKKVTDNGGSVLVPPTDIPTVGRFCVFQDPHGAHLSAIAYAHQEAEAETT